VVEAAVRVDARLIANRLWARLLSYHHRHWGARCMENGM